MCVFIFRILTYLIVLVVMIYGQDYEEKQFGPKPLGCYTEYKRDTPCELSFLGPIYTLNMIILFVASYFFGINAAMILKKLKRILRKRRNWQAQGRINRGDDEYGDVTYGMGPRNEIDQEVVKEVNQNADPEVVQEVDQKGNRNIDALQKNVPQSEGITTDEEFEILSNLMRCLNIADNSVSDDSKTTNIIDVEMLPIDNDIYAKEDDVSNIQEEDVTYLSAERQEQNKEKELVELVAQHIKSRAESLTENKNSLQIGDLFENKSLIQNSESDSAIVMKIFKQSNHGQSVFSPAKDWSLGDSQDNNAHKILKSSQSDGTCDIDLAINDNLSSTSSHSKPPLSDNCLVGSDIFKIPEKTSEKSVDFIDIADEDLHPNTPEEREAKNSPDEIVEVVLYDPDGNQVIVKFKVLSDV